MSLPIALTGHTLAGDGSVPPQPLPLASAHCVLASAPPAAALRAFATSLFAALAPGAPLEAQCAAAAPPAFTPAQSAELWRALCAQLVLAGFVEVCDVGRSGGSGEGAAWGVAARKPAWAGSGGAPLRGAALRGGRAVGTPAPAAAPAAAAGAVEQGVVLVGAAPSAAAAAAAWGAAAASGSGAQLVDEDALLAGEDFAEGKAAAGSGEAGCATKRKACANCSCGCVGGAAPARALCRAHCALLPPSAPGADAHLAPPHARTHAHTHTHTPARLRAGARRWSRLQRQGRAAAQRLALACPTPRLPPPPAPAATAARATPFAARAAPTWGSPPFPRTRLAQ